ncbi:MAG TPA: hypothetical protein VJK08_03570, partial [Patescibacteria group bacterium]|nr:hypothetical protein [Patescibacteria group bacterium]
GITLTGQALSLTGGYVIPTTTEETNWNTAYGWGNHAGLYDTVGTASSAVSTHAALQTGIHGISITAGKTFSSTGTLTLSGTDGSTLNIGTGGTLGTAAYTASSAYEPTVTWGDGLASAAGTASVDYNTTNLKITANQLDTIQGIGAAASPTFEGLTLGATGATIGTAEAYTIIDEGGGSKYVYSNVVTGAPTIANSYRSRGTSAVPLDVVDEDRLLLHSNVSGWINGAWQNVQWIFAEAETVTGGDSITGRWNFGGRNAAGAGSNWLALSGAAATFPEQRVNINNATSSAGLFFGTGDGTLESGGTYDTQIYRSAADMMRTPDSLTIDTNLTVSGHTIFEGVTSTGATGTGKMVYDTSPILVTPTIGAATATSIAIGANTLTTAEWAFLDGQNQAVKTTSSPTFANLTDSGLTATRVTYAGTAGLLQDSANLTYDGITFNSGVPTAALTTAVGSAPFKVNTTNPIAYAAENTTASATNQGAFIDLFSNDGAAVAAGDRLGGIIMGGSYSASAVFRSAAVAAFAESNWVDNTDFGTYISFETVAAGTNTRTEKMRLTSAGQLSLSTGSSTGGIVFGDGAGGYDTQIYRSAANMLRTPDGMTIDLDLFVTGSIGSTGSRVLKGWFTDLQATNAITGSITGNAVTVTTNANLTGVITSAGNATSIASQTGTGTKFVVDTSPVLITPTLGVASATSLTVTEPTGTDYKFTSDSVAGRLALLSTTAGQANTVDLFTTDGDGTDGVGFQLYAKGTVADVTTAAERLLMIYSAANTDFEIVSLAAGTGTTRPIKLYTGSNTSQQILNIDGSTSFGGAVSVTGDIYTTAWTDYSATSTIVGWSSYTTQQIYYKKVGKMVFASFVLAGTSNSTSVTFTLPVTAAAAPGSWGNSLFDTRDNGSVLTTAGRCYILAGGTTVTCNSNGGAGAWTNSGTKQVNGELWYEAT